VRNLSKGMRQRLGLAQALVHNPDVLILDEPTIGIDPQQVIEVREQVRALGKDHTVLFSTHILSEAEQVCDRVLIIDRGRIIAEGKPAELRAKLQPGMSLYVQMRGVGREEGAQLLKGLNGAAQVEPQGEGFIVRTQPGKDIRGDIFNAVARADGALVELRPVAMTLEDIFLDLVGREGGKK
jgi:ABC-2 type transport system ATP-binding protein